MNEQFIPWWSALLLIMWAVAVTLWIHPRVNRELRMWAGLASLVYLVLIVIALTASPLPTPTPSVDAERSAGNVILLAAFITISLAAGLWQLAPVSLWCRQFCYAVFTLANAGVCLALQQPELGLGLLIVAGLACRPVILSCWGAKDTLTLKAKVTEFIQFTTDFPGSLTEFWRIGAVISLLAMTLLGTTSYSACIESVVPGSESQPPLLPSTGLVSRVLREKSDVPRSTSLIDSLLSTRPDIVVLIAILVFVKLGTTMTEHVPTTPASAPADRSPTPPGENP